MGVVGDYPQLLQVFEEETGPEQVELDLHCGRSHQPRSWTCTASHLAFCAGLVSPEVLAHGRGVRPVEAHPNLTSSRIFGAVRIGVPSLFLTIVETVFRPQRDATRHRRRGHERVAAHWRLAWHVHQWPLAKGTCGS